MAATSKYPNWAVIDGDSVSCLARPHDDGTVTVTARQNWNRTQWKEFKSQVDELFDIAEREDPA